MRNIFISPWNVCPGRAGTGQFHSKLRCLTCRLGHSRCRMDTAPNRSHQSRCCMALAPFYPPTPSPNKFHLLLFWLSVNWLPEELDLGNGSSLIETSIIKKKKFNWDKFFKHYRTITQSPNFHRTLTYIAIVHKTCYKKSGWSEKVFEHFKLKMKFWRAEGFVGGKLKRKRFWIELQFETPTSIRFEKIIN